MKKVSLQNLGKIQLKRLRSDIVLNSVFLNDYENRYGFDTQEVSELFDGYLNYLDRLLDENAGGKYIHTDDDTYYKDLFALDNITTLWDYYINEY